MTNGLLVALFPVAAALSSPSPDRYPPSRTPMPYVTVYQDDATTFQVRRDPITRLGDGVYKVWLRWLWAEPRRLPSGVESATMIVAEVDCHASRVRETRILHRDRAGTVFEVDETKADELRWKTFPEGSGAASALRQVCRFIPGLLREGFDETPPKP